MLYFYFKMWQLYYLVSFGSLNWWSPIHSIDNVDLVSPSCSSTNCSSFDMFLDFMTRWQCKKQVRSLLTAPKLLAMPLWNSITMFFIVPQQSCSDFIKSQVCLADLTLMALWRRWQPCRYAHFYCSWVMIGSQESWSWMLYKFNFVWVKYKAVTAFVR